MVRVRCSAQSEAAPKTSINTYGSITMPYKSEVLYEGIFHPDFMITFEPAPRGFGRSVPEMMRR